MASASFAADRGQLCHSPLQRSSRRCWRRSATGQQCRMTPPISSSANIMGTLTAPALKGAPYRGPRLLQSATKLVREVDRYLIEAGSRPIHTSELCEVFNVSRRTLHRVFVEVHDVPPITFMRRKRLCDVRAALRSAAKRRAVMIRDIAIEHGFAELGRFAAAYRQMWGELPSQTLRRAQRRSK